MTETELVLPPEKHDPKRQASAWNFLDVLLMAAAAIALLLLGTWLLNRLSEAWLFPDLDPAAPPLGYNALLAALETIVLVVSVFVVGLWRKKLPLSAVGLQKAPPRWLVASILLTLIVIPMMGLVALVIQTALGQPLENPQLEFLAPAGFSWPGAISMFLMGGIAVPFAEELFFRGVLYQWMRSFMNVWIAIPLNALVFGLLHGNLSVAGATALMGLLLAWFYERSGSLWPSIIIHITNNALKLLLLYLLVGFGVDMTSF